MTENTSPCDMTLAALEHELDEPSEETPIKTMQAAYVDRMDALSGFARDFITEAIASITYERFDEITGESINRDEFPEEERRLIYAMIQAAIVTVPEPDHIERLRNEVGGSK